MKSTYKIIKWHETCGDKFFTLAITNQDGTHTDVFSEHLVTSFLKKGARFEVDMENEDLVQALESIAYISISEDEDGLTSKPVFDVYLHTITADDFLEVNVGGTFLKSYKTEKGAMNFASKQGHPVQ